MPTRAKPSCLQKQRQPIKAKGQSQRECFRIPPPTLTLPQELNGKGTKSPRRTSSSPQLAAWRSALLTPANCSYHRMRKSTNARKTITVTV
eukprot:5755562-Amphidinium_carterae.2